MGKFRVKHQILQNLFKIPYTGGFNQMLIPVRAKIDSLYMLLFGQTLPYNSKLSQGIVWKYSQQNKGLLSCFPL